MTNPLKGEVGFDVGSEHYTLCIDFGAMAKIEGLTDKSFPAFAGQFQDPAKIRISDVILLFWVGLQRHHPQITKDAAADLMQEMGSLETPIALIAQAMTRGQQQVEGKPRPPKPDRRK